MQPPLEPDEIITTDGVRVQLRPRQDQSVRGRTPAVLAALAAAPVVVPMAVAGAAALVGLGVAAAGAGLARTLLTGLTPGGDVQPVWPGPLQVTVIVVEQRWVSR